VTTPEPPTVKGRRGEVWHANLDPPRTGGHEQAEPRPVIIVQTNDLEPLRTVVVVPLTTNLSRGTFISGVLVPAAETGLPQDSVALCEQVTTIDRQRLAYRRGEMSRRKMREIENALHWVLGLPIIADDSPPR
jgi:mRNA interferase MazF